MLDLLVFRLQSSVWRFWQNNPAKMAIGTALLVALVMGGGCLVPSTCRE